MTLADFQSRFFARVLARLRSNLIHFDTTSKKTKIRLARYSAAARFQSNFQGKLDSRKKLDVYATKRTDLGINFSSILGKKNAPKFGAFFTFISRILYECLAYFALAFL